MQCQHKKRDGKRCGAAALTGQTRCAIHAEPGRAAEIGSKGGRRRSIYNLGDLRDFAAPKTAADLRELLAESIIEIRLRDANQLYVLWTAIPKSKKLGCGPVARPTKTKPQTHQLRNEAQLNCVSLRSSLDYVVAWRPVKGRDERPKTAPLTALHATQRSIVDVGGKKIWRAATSALTFMTFS